MAGSFTLETHVTGIRAHGRSTTMVIDCGEFPHDSNLTIEIMLRMFADQVPYIPMAFFLSKTANALGPASPSAVCPDGQHLQGQ